jgi:hypothetical protein
LIAQIIAQSADSCGKGEAASLQTIHNPAISIGGSRSQLISLSGI